MFAALLHTLLFTASVAYARCDVRVSIVLASPITSVGQSQKIYATIDNPCDEDVEGTASFSVNGTSLASKPFSVRTGGRTADAWVTWIPKTAESASIRIDVSGTLDPSRTATNATANTTVKVEIDTDRDSIPDSTDEDDDNDGLTDAQERALGTDPKQMDTDHDGVDDKRDAFPLDPNKTVLPPPVVVTQPVSVPAIIPKPVSATPAPKPKVLATKIVNITPQAEAVTNTGEPTISSTTSSTEVVTSTEEAPAPIIESPSTTIIESTPPPTPSSSGTTQLLWTIAIVTGIAGASFFALSIKK